MRGGGGKARFVTGVAGNPEDSFLVETHYWNKTKWQKVAINNYETTGFLSPEQCDEILDKNDPHLSTFDDDPERFLKKANDINKTLQENEIPVGERAHVIAAILLAMARTKQIHIHKRPTDLAREVNGNIEELLKDHGKEKFTRTISLNLPATEKNHQKYRKAIVDTMQHLREMNIRSAINSGDDALGKFYETFLKYANGAKEMGIVLTPRHITKFAVEVVGIGPNDRVYDPACGTGGFLVSAMDTMRKRIGADRPEDYNKFQKNGLTGVEQRDDVYGLALVNMIFRGDGKSRVYDGNCFDHQFWYRDGKAFYTLPKDKEPEGARRPFSHVLMNPPFKLKGSPETRFVNHALEQLKPGGILFAVLPAVVIGGKKENENWRKELLKRHTVLAVVKFDKNVFYPIGEGTYGLILRSHEPHDISKHVFMGVLMDDKHRQRRSKMLSSHNFVDNVERMTKDLRRFIARMPVKDTTLPREQILTTINPDEGCVFSPEAYLPNRAPKTPARIVKRAVNLDAAEAQVRLASIRFQRTLSSIRAFSLEELIEREVSPPLKALKDYPAGLIPVISATYYENGIKEWLDVPADLRLRDCMTISKTHNTKPCEAFWHPYEFSAINTVHIVKPISVFAENKSAMIYLCQAVMEDNAWRYDYARTVNLHEIEVYLPERNGYPDIDIIVSIAENQMRVR